MAAHRLPPFYNRLPNLNTSRPFPAHVRTRQGQERLSHSGCGLLGRALEPARHREVLGAVSGPESPPARAWGAQEGTRAESTAPAATTKTFEIMPATINLPVRGLPAKGFLRVHTAGVNEPFEV
jgi:hypothetical protein